MGKSEEAGTGAPAGSLEFMGEHGSDIGEPGD